MVPTVAMLQRPTLSNKLLLRPSLNKIRQFKTNFAQWDGPNYFQKEGQVRFSLLPFLLFLKSRTSDIPYSCCHKPAFDYKPNNANKEVFGLTPLSGDRHGYMYDRDVSAGATGATTVAPKFSDTLTLSQPGGADSAPTH